MALAFLSTPYNDLDNLSPGLNAASVVDNADGTYDTTEIHIDCNGNGTFYFKGAGDFAEAGTGITGQALYSFFKYVWKNVPSITRYDFPMLSITNEQFEFINGWSADDGTSVSQTVSITGDGNIDFNNGTSTITHTGSYDFRQFEAGDVITVTGTTSNNTTYTVTGTPTKTEVQVTVAPTAETDQSATLSTAFSTTTTEMIRTAGWGVADAVNGSYNKLEYAGIVSLGSFVDVVDRAYYAQDASFTADVADTKYTGPVNEVVRIKALADANASGANDITFDGSNTITTPADGTDLSVFRSGDVITVSNTSSNNGTYTVTGTPTATSMSIVETGTSEGPVGATLSLDLTSYYKLFLRERGKLYADSSLPDIGVSQMTYIVYRFPLSNGNDLKITTTVDTQIDSNAAVPADVSPYDAIQVNYLTNPDSGTGVVNIVGPWTSGTTYSLGDVVYDSTDSQGNGTASWYYVDATTGASNGANMAADTNNTWTRWDDSFGEREVSGVRYAFSVIIDAEDTHANVGTPYTFSGGASKEEVYEFAQWGLRLSGPIDEGATSRNGNVADSLVEFIGDVLHTKPGVFIDSFKETDANNIVFHDWQDATAGYPLTVTVTINFNNNLSSDTDAVFRAYYSDLSGDNDFDNVLAIEVNKADLTKVGADVSNNVPDGATGSSYEFSYAYDEDTAGGNRTVSQPTDITVVAIGLGTGQYVKASGQITTAGATISLVAPLERNYANPA